MARVFQDQVFGPDASHDNYFDADERIYLLKCRLACAPEVEQLSVETKIQQLR